MSKTKPFNLRLSAELIAEMKIQAIREGRSVKEIAAELFAEYLRKAKTKK
jgi:predicted HicB family RNase H-like nuclease